MKIKNKKQILFYCASHPFEMIYKIAKIFREKNYETILITMSERDRFDFKFYSEAFDKIICSNFQISKSSMKSPFYLIKKIPSFVKFLISIKILNPYIVIGVSGVNWQLKLLHKHFFKKFPFIYFPYDIISFSFDSKESALKATKLFEIEAERYCLENSQGIIHKGGSNELKYLNERIHKNLTLPKRQLNFLPYCSKEFIVAFNRDKLSKKDNFFHMVYIGGFPSDSILTNEFKTILQQGIHIHTYVTFKHLSEKEENSYISRVFNEIVNNKFFHIQHPLGPKELIPEISRYDFGFWTSKLSNGKDIEPLFATGNKLASYLEAGIPFIYNKQLVFVDKLMKKYKLSMSFNDKNLKDLKKRLQKINWKKIERNIIIARKDLSMEKNFARLENFINKIVRDFNRENIEKNLIKV